MEQRTVLELPSMLNESAQSEPTESPVLQILPDLPVVGSTQPQVVPVLRSFEVKGDVPISGP